jgi:hypothetical protein
MLYSKDFTIIKKIKLSKSSDDFIKYLQLKNEDLTCSYIINIALQLYKNKLTYKNINAKIK